MRNYRNARKSVFVTIETQDELGDITREMNHATRASEARRGVGRFWVILYIIYGHFAALGSDLGWEAGHLRWGKRSREARTGVPLGWRDAGLVPPPWDRD
jgi:hypothetical protein